jgi:hypothetical protein
MTSRRPCPPAPGPLEHYATQFDPLLSSLAQRRGLRDDLQGLLLPRDRNKTLTPWPAPSRSPAPSIVRCSGCSGSCRSRPGTTSGLTSSGSNCLRLTGHRPHGQGCW